MFKKIYIIITIAFLSQNLSAAPNCKTIDVASKNTFDVPWSFSFHEEKAPELCVHKSSKSNKGSGNTIEIRYLDLSIIIEYLSKGFILPVPAPVEPDTYEPAPSTSIPFAKWKKKGVKSWIIGMDISFVDANGTALFHVQKTQMADSSSNGFQIADWKIDISEKTEYFDKIAGVVLTPNFNRFPPGYLSDALLCVNNLDEVGVRHYSQAICRHMSGSVLFELSPIKECSCKVVDSGYEISGGGEQCQVLDCDLEMPSLIHENPLLTQGQEEDVSELCDTIDCNLLCENTPQLGFCQ